MNSKWQYESKRMIGYVWVAYNLNLVLMIYGFVMDKKLRNIYRGNYRRLSVAEFYLMLSRKRPSMLGLILSEHIERYWHYLLKDGPSNSMLFNEIFDYMRGELGEDWVARIEGARMYEMQDIALFFHFVEKYFDKKTEIFRVYRTDGCEGLHPNFELVRYISLSYHDYWRGMHSFYDEDFIKIDEGAISNGFVEQTMANRLRAKEVSAAERNAIIEKVSDWVPRVLNRSGV